MVLIKIALLLVNLCSIKVCVVCENFLVLKNEKFDEILSSENRQEDTQDLKETQENEVLNSVYDAMKNNLQTKFNRINLLSDIRNRRNTNYVQSFQDRDPQFSDYDMNINEIPLTTNSYFEKKYDNHAKRYRNYGTRTPLAYRDVTENNRAGYGGYGSYEEEYVKCHDTRPAVHTIEVEHSGGHGKALFQESFYAVLLVGLKYLLGGLILITLPFVIAKAVLIPLKFIIGLKVIAFANTFLFAYYFLRFLKKWLRFYPKPVLAPLPGFSPLSTHGLGLKSNQKLETIKQILNNDNFVEDEDDLSGTEDIAQSRISEVSETANGTVEGEYEEALIRDLIKLIKKRNKNW